jgi:hypothetical protein
MTTYTKHLLSASGSGLGILVSASATPGTTIHTAISGSVNLDEIWIYGVNSGSANAKLTLEWGEQNAPNGNIEVTLPTENGLVLVSPGLLLQGSLAVKAFSDISNVIIIHGFVNRITQ